MSATYNEPAIVTNIESFINDSNRHFKDNDLPKAAACAEKAYSLAKHFENCSELAIKKIEFNLATIYAASNSFEVAKSWLDCVKGSEICFTKVKDIAILYNKIGDYFQSDKNEIKKRIECYQSAAVYYAKSKDWHSFCQVELTHAKLLIEENFIKEANRIASKVLAACLYLEENIELAKIYNDLATVYARDVKNEANAYLSKRLLNKALNLIKEKNVNASSRLEICIFLNLSAVNNRLEKYHESLSNIKYAFIKMGTAQDDFLVCDLKFNEGYALTHLEEYDDAIKAFEQCHEYALTTRQKNLWESLEALGAIYAMVKKNDNAKKLYEKAKETFYEYCKSKNLRVNRRVENRLSLKIKRLNSTHENFDVFNGDEEIELENDDENKNEVRSMSRLSSANDKRNSIEKDKFESHQLDNDLKFQNYDLNENILVNQTPKQINQEVINENTLNLTKTSDSEKNIFTSNEIVNEVNENNDKHHHLAIVLGEALIVEEKAKKNILAASILNDSNLKMIAKEALHAETELNNKNIDTVKTEPFTSHDNLASTIDSMNMNMIKSNSSLRKNIDEYKKVMEQEEERLAKHEKLEEINTNSTIASTTLDTNTKSLIPETDIPKESLEKAANVHLDQLITNNSDEKNLKRQKSSKKRFYRDFNRGSVKNHPENLVPEQSSDKSQKPSKICILS